MASSFPRPHPPAFALLFALAGLGACNASHDSTRIEGSADGLVPSGAAGMRAGDPEGGSAGDAVSLAGMGGGQPPVAGDGSSQVPDPEDLEGGAPITVGSGDGDAPVPQLTTCAPAPPASETGSFPALRVEWTYRTEEGTGAEVGLPLVANLTDDNDDGVIDTRDVPDVAVQEMIGGHLTVLDGATGEKHYSVLSQSPYGSFHAIGDLDADGVPEIVLWSDLQLAALEGDTGAWKWRQPMAVSNVAIGTISLADLTGDGTLEILSQGAIFSSVGSLIEQMTEIGSFSPPFAADVEGDSEQEIIYAAGIYHFEGSSHPRRELDDGEGFMQIADFDRDGDPEIVVAKETALIVFDHTGVELARIEPAQLGPSFGTLFGPAVIADVNGDGAPDIAIPGESAYAVLNADLTPQWIVATGGGAYVIGATAFDFDGDGLDEIVYADRTRLHVFGANAADRASFDLGGTAAIGAPIVADIDNDGSAEILVGVNTETPLGRQGKLVALGAADGRAFMPARRIFNQYAYQVSAITEAARAPSPEPDSWRFTNTFRAQAAIDEDGNACRPQ